MHFFYCPDSRPQSDLHSQIGEDLMALDYSYGARARRRVFHNLARGRGPPALHGTSAEVPELQATRTWWASPCIVQGLNTVSRSWACTPRSRQHGLQGQGPLLLLQELAAALQAHSVRPTPTMPTTPGGARTPACRHGRAKGDQVAEEVTAAAVGPAEGDQAAEEVTVQPFFRFVVAEPTAPQTRAGWGT